jgi:DNA (cytosine-5)-methyltransferase 1
MKNWKTVELFCGIGGFRIAADALNIETVWANDIGDLAKSVYIANFGKEVFHDGDIQNLIQTIPQHDILTAGFPCQPFSSAGKKKGTSEPRGTLFSEIVKILKLNNPRFFVLENVKRLLSMDSGKHFATILSALTECGYCVEWRVVNARWFGLPQHRERIVIIGWKDPVLRSYFYHNRDKIQEESIGSVKIRQSLIHRIAEHHWKFSSWGLAWEEWAIDQELDDPLCSIFSNAKLHDVLEKDPLPEFFFTEDTLKRIEDSDPVNRYFNGVEILYNQRGGARMGYSIFGVNGVAPTLTSTTSRHYERYRVGNEYRRLTNIEYARLQGFPDHHCDAVSPYHQYALFGNAVPPCLVQWVMSQLINNCYFPIEITQESLGKQMELSFF